jgi:amino acid adenylation domain-containing protein
MLYLLHDYLREAAEKCSNKTAIKSGGKTVTYRELYKHSISFAAYLNGVGVQRGDRVLVAFGNSLETVIAFWGTLLANAVVSVINSEQPVNKITYVMQDSGAKVICTNKAEIAVNSNQKLLDVDQFYSVLDLVGHVIPRRIAIDVDLASIIYTSGSTGDAKGVMMTHRNMLAASQSINSYLKNSSEDVIFCVLPLSFDYGLYQMIMAVSVGATLILEKNFLLPTLALKKIFQEKVTALPCVPSMVSLFKEHQNFKSYDLSSVRYVTNTGAALSYKHIAYLQELFPQALIYSMYGVTECKRCTYLPPEEITTKPSSVGRAIPNTEIFVVDENGKTLAPGQVGQLVVRGATVMQGYWNKPELTAEKLKPGLLPSEKLLYTGDYGYLDQDNYFYFCGRMDEVIKCRGVKVSPKEIEEVVLRLDEVMDATLIGVESSNGNVELVLFVSISKETQITELFLYEHCRCNLEKEKVPSKIFIMDSLPKNSNGKIDKIALRDRVYLCKK